MPLLDLEYIPHTAAAAAIGGDDWPYLEGLRLKRKRSAALAIALLLGDDDMIGLLGG